MKILLVDDQLEVNQSLKDAIEPGGHNCKICLNPLQVPDLLKKDFYDVVIMDYKMPEMDGLELMKQIRKINPGVDVIFHSGYLTEDVVINAANLGAYTVYRKPLNLRLLLKNLDEISLTKQTSGNGYPLVE